MQALVKTRQESASATLGIKAHLILLPTPFFLCLPPPLSSPHCLHALTRRKRSNTSCLTDPPKLPPASDVILTAWCWLLEAGQRLSVALWDECSLSTQTSYRDLGVGAARWSSASRVSPFAKLTGLYISGKEGREGGTGMMNGLYFFTCHTGRVRSSGDPVRGDITSQGTREG